MEACFRARWANGFFSMRFVFRRCESPAEDVAARVQIEVRANSEPHCDPIQPDHGGGWNFSEQAGLPRPAGEPCAAFSEG